MNKIDLGFGNSYCVRESYLEQVNFISISKNELSAYDYPKYEGDHRLIELTKNVIKRQTGQDYKYIIITNGATGAISIALKEARLAGKLDVLTRNAPYYSKYPKMIKNAGMVIIEEKELSRMAIEEHECAVLLDFPSNPKALLTDIETLNSDRVIIDCVYHNMVYGKSFTPNLGLPSHNAMIGSYGKLLGLNGIRTGWIATNDESLYLAYKDIAEIEYCGISRPSQDLTSESIEFLNWELFETSARKKLDDNRESISKLERIFDYSAPVPEIGMFYYTGASPKSIELLEKAQIVYTKGSAMGTDDSYVRLSLGQTRENTAEAVNRILKMDSKK